MGRRKPKRIQLRRTKGWRKPEGAVVVSRPSKWGNPWKASECGSADAAVKAFREYITLIVREQPRFIDDLRGKDLCCWCRESQPCHADVLLELANGGGL